MVSTISLRRRLLARGIYFLLHLCLASRDVRASRSGPRENLRATVIAYVHMGCGTGHSTAAPDAPPAGLRRGCGPTRAWRPEACGSRPPGPALLTAAWSAAVICCARD